MGRRHLARELALKVLFELEGDGGDVERSLQYHVAESRADAEVADFARTLILGVREHQAEIDAHLAEASRNWGLDQMAKVERTLLRIAAFEIRYRPPRPDQGGDQRIHRAGQDVRRSRLRQVRQRHSRQDRR